MIEYTMPTEEMEIDAEIRNKVRRSVMLAMTVIETINRIPYTFITTEQLRKRLVKNYSQCFTLLETLLIHGYLRKERRHRARRTSYIIVNYEDGSAKIMDLKDVALATLKRAGFEVNEE